MPGFIEKNRRPLFVLALFLFLFWLLTHQVRAGRLRMLERPVLAVNAVIGRIVTWPYRTADAALTRYVLLVRTERENRRLREQIRRLKLENRLVAELLAENERLRSALGFLQLQPLRSLVAQVVIKESSTLSSTFTINKGAADGVERNMAVITADGIVGRIQTAIDGAAKVMLITDPGSTIAVRVHRNREEGLLEGKLDRCALKYVSYYIDIQEGDILVSSGLDGIYPRGLPVAVVTSVSKQEASSFQTVYARPIVRFSRLEEVLVVQE